MWRVDPDRITQVIVNLVANAIQATPQGGRIQITATRTARTWQVTITDDGPGIPPEHVALVFERFHRVNPNQTEGSGLGLAIAREIIERHGGKIGLTSQLEVGTRVSFELPSLPGARIAGRDVDEIDPGEIR
jgi:signal transduction histidine kinase